MRFARTFSIAAISLIILLITPQLGRADPFVLPFSQRIITWEAPGVNGKVKSVDEAQFLARAVAGKETELPMNATRFIFDDARVAETDTLTAIGGAPQQPIKYTYDNSGRLIGASITNFLDAVVANYAVEYAADGKGCTVVEKDAKTGAALMHVSCELNEKAMPRKIAQGQGIQLGIEYDEKGRWSKAGVVGNSGAYITRSSFVYNDHGFVAAETSERSKSSFGPGGSQTMTFEPMEKITYEYQYDDQGNWTERKAISVTFFAGKERPPSATITRRKITYAG